MTQRSPVKDIGIEARVHALARPAGAERATASHQAVQHAHRNEVCLVLVRKTLQS